MTLTPEHKKRNIFNKEIDAAYNYVTLVSDTCDTFDDKYRKLWYGWALREAFLAGITYAKTANENDLQNKKQIRQRR